MKVSAATRLFVSRAFWGLTGIDAAGRVLVEVLDAEDEDVRAIAGILLTKAGRRAGLLLGAALARGEHVPMVLSVLGSIGDPEIVPELRPFAQSDDPDVARAAQEAIRTLEADRV